MPRIDCREKLQQFVNEFVTTIGYDKAPSGGQLIVTKPCYPYDLSPESYENCGLPGCYVFTCGEGKPLYVGKASRYLGNRMWAHTGRRNKGEEIDVFPTATTWAKQNSPDLTLYSVSIPDEHWWLALALEGFLTEKLLPHLKRP